MAHDLVKLGMRLFNDLLATYFFYVPMKERTTGKLQKIVAYAVPVLIVITMWPENFWPYLTIGTAVARFLLRLLIYLLFLRLSKEGSFLFHFYNALLLTIVWTNFTNIFMASPFLEFRTEMVRVFENPVWNVFFVHAVQIMISFTMVCLVRKNCEFHQEKDPDIFVIGLFAFISAVIVYMKQSMKDRVDYGNQFQAMSEISIYYFVVLVLVYFSVIMIERFERMERMKNKLEVAAVLQNYKYEALLEKEKAEDRFRFLKHDMKNHLSAIKSMADDNQKVRAYIEELQGQMEEDWVVIETGNRMINGLMSEKIRWAREYGISMHVNLDLSESSFIQEVDLCTIIANAVDNAIEASIQVKQQEKRRIHLWTECEAGCFVFECKNYYENDLVRDNDQRLISGKNDPEQHGLGISSIRCAVKRYQGSCVTETDAQHYFILRVTIPIQY